MMLYAAQYYMFAPLQDMLIIILKVLLTPMILGYITRLGHVRWLDDKKF